WMPMTFRPTETMNLNDLCAYTATYIFKPDPEQLLGDEVLIKTTSNVFGDRQALKSLMPRRLVDQQQYVLEAHKGADYVRNLYQARFMRPGEYVSRVSYVLDCCKQSCRIKNYVPTT
ncbi:Ulp1 protease family carboxy-terminal domain protein, partial [Trifolium medium]|nr:Ulp1 protease family carboxy-terminal domain protein [Trifolium medium]